MKTVAVYVQEALSALCSREWLERLGEGSSNTERQLSFILLMVFFLQASFIGSGVKQDRGDNICPSREVLIMTLRLWSEAAERPPDIVEAAALASDPLLLCFVALSHTSSCPSEDPFGHPCHDCRVE